jgi:hypothetical protein
MHTGKELEEHRVQKVRLSCDSDAPQVRSARSDWTRVAQVNRHIMNCRKTRSYCIFLAQFDVTNLMAEEKIDFGFTRMYFIFNTRARNTHAHFYT